MTDSTITKGCWVRYHGSRTYLLGQIYEVVRVYGDRIRLRGALVEFTCRSSRVSKVC